MDDCQPSQTELQEDGTALGLLETFRSCVRHQWSVSEAWSGHCRADAECLGVTFRLT